MYKAYREFEGVLGITGIDEYIRYGGTMSLGGINYNADAIFSNSKTAEEYIATAIAKNIQHSLKMYQYGGHFRQLLDLYERGELTNVINRVVENINHSFTRSVVERTFKSHDISVTAANMLRDRENPINIKEHMDLIMEINLESLPEVNQKSKVTVITQPGMRYAQANAIVENLLLDAKFQELSIQERQRILEQLLNLLRHGVITGHGCQRSSNTRLKSADAIFKSIYLTMVDITKKWTGVTWNWGQTLEQLMIYFGVRISPSDLD